jgi:hypothetical protein
MKQIFLCLALLSGCVSVGDRCRSFCAEAGMECTAIISGQRIVTPGISTKDNPYGGLIPTITTTAPPSNVH